MELLLFQFESRWEMESNAVKRFIHTSSRLQRWILLDNIKGPMQVHEATDKPLLWKSTLGQLLAIQLKQVVSSKLLLEARHAAEKISSASWKRITSKNVDTITLGTLLALLIVCLTRTIQRCLGFPRRTRQT